VADARPGRAWAELARKLDDGGYSSLRAEATRPCCRSSPSWRAR